MSDAPLAEQRFCTTHWSAVLHAGRPESPQAARALEKLCRAYWNPLYAFIRRRGYESETARDLTQAFFENLLERNTFARADANRGKFRTFLLCALNNFLATQRERSLRQKRGGAEVFLSLDAAEDNGGIPIEPADHLTPETIFDRRWAEALLQLVMARLRENFEATNPGRRFDDLQVFLVEERGSNPFAEAARRMGLTEAALKSTVHRLRKRYRELIREEVAQTVDQPEDVEPEIRHLLASLRG